MKKNRKTKACMYCGVEYLFGDLHRCHSGYDNVMASQDKIRESQLWKPTLTSPTVSSPPAVAVEWPATSLNIKVIDHINELHEMILDLNLRIQDLEEERA